ncbi:hypothetical protein [Sporolactobacillus nakayamae]|uniref:hypothetical protein n=1 Tax=Sporolactobacillus nakayamae TaxID=269670 RepID=UPI001FE1A718|nr:hypothetical protein [Sporolactobacillus nakayamae]
MELLNKAAALEDKSICLTTNPIRMINIDVNGLDDVKNSSFLEHPLDHEQLFSHCEKEHDLSCKLMYDSLTA